jgi:hypothetical protein
MEGVLFCCLRERKTSFKRTAKITHEKIESEWATRRIKKRTMLPFLLVLCQALLRGVWVLDVKGNDTVVRVGSRSSLKCSSTVYSNQTTVHFSMQGRFYRDSSRLVDRWSQVLLETAQQFEIILALPRNFRAYSSRDKGLWFWRRDLNSLLVRVRWTDSPRQLVNCTGAPVQRNTSRFPNANGKICFNGSFV